MDREHPPKNPFKPRPGAVPPFLAGRDEELRAVEANILRPLQDGEEASSNAALVSPRGFGKTALAETLRLLAEREGLRTLDASGSALGTMGELMAATIGREATAQVQTTERHAKERSVSLRTLLSGGWGKTAERERTALQEAPSTREWEVEWERQCREAPLLMMVDEAHTLDLEVARTLLNAVQNIQKRGVPLALLLAGTPDLPHHLQGTRAKPRHPARRTHGLHPQGPTDGRVPPRQSQPARAHSEGGCKIAQATPNPILSQASHISSFSSCQ